MIRSHLILLFASLSLGGLAETHVLNKIEKTVHLPHLSYVPGAQKNQRLEEGVKFICPPSKIEMLEQEMDKYLAQLNIDPDLVIKKTSPSQGTLLYTLNTPKNDTSTLDLSSRPHLKIKEDEVELPLHGGGERKIKTVSKKEIVLSLLQHGRLTQFSGEGCDIQALKDNVGIRQNIAAWTQELKWGWPATESEDGKAFWNKAYWENGTPLPGIPPHVAFLDTVLQQEKYAIGCYTASKIAMTNGILDYYARIKKDPKTLALVEKRLLLDKDPLVSVEPQKMWSFEADFDPKKESIPGKVLKLESGIAPNNIIAGDWIYLLNTDPVTYKKNGYEGSNAIYLGRNLLDDFYFDERGQNFTYKQKIQEVYNWRNRVFNRVRDRDRIKHLTEEEVKALSKTPEEGGLQLDLRVSPYFFGFEDLDEFPQR